MITSFMVSKKQYGAVMFGRLPPHKKATYSGQFVFTTICWNEAFDLGLDVEANNKK